MITTEEMKEDLIKKIKDNDLEEALDVFLQLIGIVEDKSTESTDEKEKLLETLFDFYALGNNASPKSF